jgi:curli biogenesis system outer membrane secretion channel CsgG
MRFIVFALALTLIGCGPVGEAIQNPGQATTQTVSTSQQSIDQVQLEAYDGPKARVAVSRFTDQSAKGGGAYGRRTGWYSPEIGNGMADMLNDALLQSNRFIVLDRQSLQDVFKEQDLGASGRIKQETAAPIGQIEGAELLIKGAITEFEPGAAGAQGGAGLGGFGLPGAFLGGALGGVQQSHVAMIIQVVDTKTSRLLFSSTVEGKANDFNLGGFLGGFGGHVAGGAGLGVWQKTPVEKAIRIAIVNAVQELSKKTPQTYFHYGAQVASASTTGPSGKAGAPASALAVQSKPGALPSSVVVKAKVANLRDTPGVQGKVIASLPEGTKLAINGEEKDWYQIQTEDGKIGWISKSLTK